MKSFLLTLLYVSFSTFSLAEIIDGPANIRDSINGNILLQIFDGVVVDCTPLENNWYRILINAKSSEKSFKKSVPPQKGDTLFSFKGIPIGIILNDFVFGKTQYGNWSAGQDEYGMGIIGYTYKSNIRPSSIIENRLEALLSRVNKPWTKSHFEKFLVEFEMINSGLLKQENFAEYMVHENSIEDPSPMDRIRLIFQNQILIGIVHSRPINIKDCDDYQLVRGRWLIIPDYVTLDHSNFIEENINSYNGVD